MKLRRKAFFVGDGVQKLSYTVSAASGPINLYSLAGPAGWNGISKVEFTVSISSGASVTASSTAGNAVTYTGGFPAGSTVTLVNFGVIAGRGGNGGTGAGPYSPAGQNNGGNGGTALYAGAPLRVHNHGTIAGGGGGGGGGGFAKVKLKSSATYSVNAVGVNGGAGATYPAAAVTPAAPIEVRHTDPDTVQYFYSTPGKGGAGGAAGANGSNGGAGAGTFVAETSNSGAQGIGGKCTVGNANITWLTTGTRLGAIS